MKIYLCSKCNKKISREEVLAHRHDEVDFQVRSSCRARSGDRRHTEYRIDPGDTV